MSDTICLASQRQSTQPFRFKLFQEDQLPRLTQSIKRLVPFMPNLRQEDDYETDEELLAKAQNDARRALKDAINKKLDKALRGECSGDENPDLCMLEKGPLAKRLRKRGIRSA